MYKKKNQDYIRSKDYSDHKTPDNMSHNYEKNDVEEDYRTTNRDDLLYRIASRPMVEREEEEEQTVTDTIRIVSREAVPRDDNESIQKLRLDGECVVGNMFDRVKFLETRIDELSSAIEKRRSINEEILKDIEEDIRDKEAFSARCSELDDVRSIKLHISMLRQQKRREMLQHFHDTMELSNQLRSFKEEYESEKKITSLFDDCNLEYKNKVDFSGAS